MDPEDGCLLALIAITFVLATLLGLHLAEESLSCVATRDCPVSTEEPEW